MRPRQLIRHYRGVTAAANAVGVSRQTVHAWAKAGRIPLQWQSHIERITDGVLRVGRCK